MFVSAILFICKRNASPASQTGDNNKADLNQSIGPIITNVAIDTDYTTLTVTFNEAVYKSLMDQVI